MPSTQVGETHFTGASPVAALGGVQHVEHEADALADRDEPNHDRKDHRKQADDLIQDAVQHASGDNAGERGGSAGSVLMQYLLERFGLRPWLRARESNPKLQVQSLPCCHCTSPLYM